MLRILRRVDYRATPWKNGGGITHEVLRSPVGETFDWRVSVARIDRPGPFSDFPAHVRHMALLEGDGVRLHIDGAQRCLSQVGDLIEFDGAATVDCELLGGACSDLNLMVAKHLSARVAVQSVHAPLALRAEPGQSLFLFNVGAPVGLSAGAEHFDLGTWDAVLLEAGAASVTPASQNAPSRVFFATICHGRQS